MRIILEIEVLDQVSGGMYDVWISLSMDSNPWILNPQTD